MKDIACSKLSTPCLFNKGKKSLYVLVKHKNNSKGLELVISEFFNIVSMSYIFSSITSELFIIILLSFL